VRKMPGEERLVDGDVLERSDPLALFDRHHAVDQQKGVAVRQEFEDLVDVHQASSGFGWACAMACSTALSRSRRRLSCLRDAAFFSQRALSSMGNIPVYCPG